VFSLVEKFEIERIFEGRTYERHEFKCKMDGNEYRGYFHEGEIQWLNPHPKEDVADSELKGVEVEVHALFGGHGVEGKTEDIEIDEPHEFN